MNTLKILAFVTLAVSSSCGSEPGGKDQANETRIPDFRLVTAGTYGSEIGDSLSMIGTADDFCYHPDGSILILDRTAMCIRMVNSSEVTLISREGEGPGELLSPMSICSLADGRILVADEAKREVMEFNTAGEYLGSYFTTDRYVPYTMDTINPASIAGAMLYLVMGEDQILFGVNFARFDSDSLPAVVFDTRQWEWPAPEMYTEFEMVDYTAAPDGTFYLTMDNTRYSISIYSSTGEMIGSIVCSDVPQIPKTEEEILEEIEIFESYAVQDDAYTGGYEPASSRQLIDLVGIDSDSNLWVQRLYAEDGFKFDIWDVNGNLLYTASFNELESTVGILFHVDQYGILASITDPELFPQVLSLEVQGGIAE